MSLPDTDGESSKLSRNEAEIEDVERIDEGVHGAVVVRVGGIIARGHGSLEEPEVEERPSRGSSPSPRSARKPA